MATVSCHSNSTNANTTTNGGGGGGDSSGGSWKSRLGFLTRQHVEEWASFGPPLFEKPTSPEQLQALKQRKEKMTNMKKQLMDLASRHPGNDNSQSTISARLIEQELDRLAQGIWNPSSTTKTKTALASNDDTDIDTDGVDFVDHHLQEYQLNNNHPDNIMDHRLQGGPLLQYLWTPSNDPVHGQTLYLGGEVGSDGHIYCIPGHASRVLKIDTIRNTIALIGPPLTTNNGRLYKWLRGIVVGDVIYGLPCHADSVLRIDLSTQSITTLPIPYADFYSDPDQAQAEQLRNWKYHGGSICPIDDCIYAIPQAASHVLKIDPTSETISFVGPCFPGRCKWYGGIVGKSDGAIYGVPQNAAGVLRITPSAITMHGDYGSNNHKWHGGAAAANGVIVSIPANSDTVLCITPAATLDGEPTLTEIGNASIIQSGRHRSDGKYKYLGAMAGTNGRVYLFPCASEYVLQVDTVYGIAKNVGPNLRDAGLELIHQNKWQNGLTCVQDQCVYGIPQSSHTLLRIDCSETTLEEDSPDPIVTTWQLPSPRIDCRDKFEGGVITESGIMYTVPNNHKGVLRIEPANLQQTK